MAKTDQELAQDILDGEGINWRYGGDTIAGALMPFRREVITPEQSQFIGYDSSGNAIIQNIPAQYGETQYDINYSPLVRGAKTVGSSLRDIFFGDANQQAEAVGEVVSALRGAVGGVADYASDQYQAALGGGTVYNPNTQQITEFDPALVLGGGSSGGGAALASGFRMSGKAPIASIIQQLRDAPESKLQYQKQALAGDENAIAALMEDKLIDRETALSQAQASVDRASYRQDYRARKQAERDAEPVMQASQADDYRGAHEPPDREYGAPLNDLTSMIPSDVYGPAGPRLYGLGDPEVDSEAFGALRSARGNPDAEVVVYRAVPKGVSEINSGDWVTTSRKYADMHGENSLGGNYEILEQKARAGDLFSEGYPYEFGWNPLSMNPEARMQRAQDLGFDTSRPLYHSTNSSFDAFEVPEGGFLKYGKGVYTTPNPQYADRYIRENRDLDRAYTEGANVMPLYARGKIATEKDWEAARQEMMSEGVTPSGYNQQQAELQRRLKEQGFDGLNMFGDEIIIFDPKNIRSTNAEFDPAKADSADLLSSVGTTSALRGIA